MPCIGMILAYYIVGKNPCKGKKVSFKNAYHVKQLQVIK